MEEIIFRAEKRDVIGKQVKGLRREGKLPAIVYGRGIDPLPIILDYREVSRIISDATSSSMVVVDLNGERHSALVRDKQFDPVTGTLLHLDFHEVSLTEKLHTMVGIEIIGEAPAVEEFNGILIIVNEQLEVECLPQDLPSRIEVDITSLAEIGDSIYIRDLSVPPEVLILTNPDEAVVLVTAPRAEEVTEEVEEIEEVLGEPEVIERGKREEEEQESQD